MKIGLFFGSFNPIHIGHLNIAQWFLNHTDLEKIIFIVSPQSPFKAEKDLMKEELRYKMLKLSIKSQPKMLVSKVEFSLPKPSYTINTLNTLKKQYPNSELVIVMGSDTMVSLPQWHEIESVLKYPIYVFRRNASDVNPYPKANIECFDTPLLNVSASYVRQLLLEKKAINFLVMDAILPLLDQK